MKQSVPTSLFKIYGFFTTIGGSLGWVFNYVIQNRSQTAISMAIQTLMHLNADMPEQSQINQSMLASNLKLAVEKGALASGATLRSAQLAAQRGFDYFLQGMTIETAAASSAATSTVLGKLGWFFKDTPQIIFPIAGIFFGAVCAWFLIRKTTKSVQMQVDQHLARLDREAKTLEIENKELHAEITLFLKKKRELDYATLIQPTESTPLEYCCPITQMIMGDPIMESDGRYYERLAVVAWYQKSKQSPVIPSLVLINPDQLLTDLELKARIRQHIQVITKSRLKNKLIDFSKRWNRTFNLTRQRKDLLVIKLMNINHVMEDKGLKTELETIKQLLGESIESIGIKSIEYQAEINWKDWTLIISAQPLCLEGVISLLKELTMNLKTSIQARATLINANKRNSKAKIEILQEGQSIITCAMQ